MWGTSWLAGAPSCEPTFPGTISAAESYCRREQTDYFAISCGETTIFCRPAFAFRKANLRHLWSDYFHICRFPKEKNGKKENFNWIPSMCGLVATKDSSRGWIAGAQKPIAHRPFFHALLLMWAQSPAKPDKVMWHHIDAFREFPGKRSTRAFWLHCGS